MSSHWESLGDECPLICDVLEEFIRNHDLQKSLSDLLDFGIVALTENLCKRGPNCGVDNSTWLNHSFPSELVEVDAQPTEVTDVSNGQHATRQCDSCERRPFDSQDEHCSLELQVV